MGRASSRKRMLSREQRLGDRHVRTWFVQSEVEALRRFSRALDLQDARHPERLIPWRNNPETGVWEVAT